MANMKGKMIGKRVYKTFAGWVKRLGDGSVIGPFKTEAIAEKAHVSPAKAEVKVAVKADISKEDKDKANKIAKEKADKITKALAEKAAKALAEKEANEKTEKESNTSKFFSKNKEG